MSRVLSLLLVPPVRQAVQARYRGYRRNGASALTAASPVSSPTWSAPNMAHSSKNFSLTSALMGAV